MHKNLKFTEKYNNPKENFREEEIQAFNKHRKVYSTSLVWKCKLKQKQMNN